MSYNAKNLAYEAKEPAFLQRLRGHYGSASGGLERPISQRPRKPRDDNDDDAPTYVDAGSNEVISKEDYEAMVSGGGDKQAGTSEKDDKDLEKSAVQAGDGSDPAKENEGQQPKQNLAEIGGPRKRKQAKVVGDDAPQAESEDRRPKDSGSRKLKQKKKKIKLSFEE